MKTDREKPTVNGLRKKAGREEFRRALENSRASFIDDLVDATDMYSDRVSEVIGGVIEKLQRNQNYNDTLE